MRKEYESILNKYKSKVYLTYITAIRESDWGNTELADAYLRKYYLPYDEYVKVWKPILTSVFLPCTKGLPEIVFQSPFSLMVHRGGCLFAQEDFEALKSCMSYLGDKYMIIVQNAYNGLLERDSLIRLKLPVDITWDEMMSGNYISAIVCQMSINEYFVFSESGLWGKYSASDYVNPLDIFGVKTKYIPVFERYFQQTLEERNELYDWLPESYLNLMFFSKRMS